MAVKKLFALASITALTGIAAMGLTAACSSSESPAASGEGGAPSSGSDRRDSGGGASGTDDDDDDATCLDETPIDPAQFPYRKTTIGVRGACTEANLTAFAKHFRENANKVVDVDAGEPDFLTTWRASVPAKCSECIFSEDTPSAPATAWAPIPITVTTAGAKSFKINRGGCIDAVASKELGATAGEACGRSYTQFQECSVRACFDSCDSQAEFDACRGDPKLSETACKAAREAVLEACGGEDAVGLFEAACRGTTYTFEGAIKQLCVTGVNAPPTDAGADADPPR